MGIALALTFWSARRRSHRLPLILAWGWWLGISFLLCLTLPSPYLLHGPRLLYLVGIGLAMLWPVLLAPLNRGKVGALFWICILGFVLLTGWTGVRAQLNRYAQLTSPLDLVEEVMRHRPPGEGVLLVNLPSWVAPTSNTYPVGAEHAASLGQHLFVEDFI